MKKPFMLPVGVQRLPVVHSVNVCVCGCVCVGVRLCVYVCVCMQKMAQ